MILFSFYFDALILSLFILFVNLNQFQTKKIRLGEPDFCFMH